MKELFTFMMPETQPVELGSNNIHAIITIDQNGQMVGELLPYKDNNGKMVTPTMPNRGSGVFAMAGSDVVQYFNPDCPKHYQANIALYEDIVDKTGEPEALALLSFAKSGVAQELDLSKVKIPKDPKTKKFDPNKVRLAFIYAPTGQYLHECPAIVDYWINLRRNNSVTQKRGKNPIAFAQVKCSITGQLGKALTDAPVDVKFGSTNGKLFSCNNDDAVSFGSPKYASTGVTTETYTELVQRLNYLGSSQDHQIFLGKQTLLIWSDGISTQPLLQGLQSLSSGEPTTAKKIRKKGNVESINITDTSFEGIKQRLLSLWKGAHAVVKLDTHSFYVTTIMSQKTKIELTPIRKAGLVDVVENIALYHAKQLRFSRYSRPYWGFLDAIYPKVTSKTKPYTDRDRGAIFNHAVYGQPLPRALIAKALSRLRVEGIPIASRKHQIKVSDRAYTQLSFLSLEIPMTEITELPPKQRQAYALGKLYSYACRMADGVSKTPNHGVRKLWGQINRNPKRALYQLAKRFPIYVSSGKEQAIFNSLYRAVMEASSEVPERVDLDYGVAFMWGISATAPKQSNDESNNTTEVESK
jgi:CRISPR-associated protein (Cas_Csd1)